MKHTFTRNCTECYTTALPLFENPTFEIRRVDEVRNFDQRLFKSQDRFNHEQIKDALDVLQARAAEEKSKNGMSLEELPKKVTLSWKDKVNYKRQLVEKVINNQTYSSIAKIAKYTGTSRELVKRIKRELVYQDRATPYEYNNIKSIEEQENLQRTIDEVRDNYETVTMIKRKHPSFSRKKILKALHTSGYKYKLLPKDQKNPDKRHYSCCRVERLISHITQSLCDNSTKILYIDEMKFPLYQTTVKQWVHANVAREDQVFYNRRPVQDGIITAIALCSVEKFEAVQLFSGEVCAQDFLYFLNKAIASFPTPCRISVIADNAGWHHSNLISKSVAGQYLFFNEPKLYELNIIENAFSYVRNAFRCRPTVNTLEEEAKYILDAFFDSDNPKRFKGFFRRHLSNLQEFLAKTHPDKEAEEATGHFVVI